MSEPEAYCRTSVVYLSMELYLITLSHMLMGSQIWISGPNVFHDELSFLMHVTEILDYIENNMKNTHIPPSNFNKTLLIQGVLAPCKLSLFPTPFLSA